MSSESPRERMRRINQKFALIGLLIDLQRKMNEEGNERGVECCAYCIADIVQDGQLLTENSDSV